MVSFDAVTGEHMVVYEEDGHVAQLLLAQTTYWRVQPLARALSCC